MKYFISISGGFAGFMKDYNGYCPLQEKDRKNLLKAMEQPMHPPGNKNMTDSFHYEVTLDFGEKKIQGSFNDLNIPPEIYEFISMIKKIEH